MRIGLLTASLSRQGGNVFPTLSVLGRSLHQPPEIDVLAFGLRDELTDSDLGAWGALSVVAAPRRGPRRMGFSRDLDVALATADLDLLHVHGLWTYTSVATRRWADATARPYIITPHGMLDPWAVRRHRWKKLGAALLFELAHLRGAVCLHARCEGEAKALRALGLRNPICVIPNPVELPPETRTGKPPPPVLADAGGNLLLCLGPLARGFNAHILLEAWRSARRASPTETAGWSLVVLGAEDDRGALMRIRATLALEDTVRFAVCADGCIPRALWAAAAAVVLLPAASEQTANAIRAWSHGRPVLLCGAAAVPADLRALAALALRPTVEDLAGGLLQLIGTTESERAAMGTKARRVIERRLAPAAIADEMAGVYRWMLGSAPKPPCVVEH